MLTLDPYTILWTVINLLVLYVLLKKFLFGPVTKIMDERQRAIENNIKDAEARKAEAEQLKADYESHLTSARAEAADLVAQAKSRAGAEYDSILAQARTDAQKVREDAQAQIQTEREQMLQGARQEVAALALLAAAKVAGRELDADGDQALVDAFLAEAGELK